MASKLSIRGLQKMFSVNEGFGSVREIRAIDNIDIEVQDNEFVCIIGPSGCGKSTMPMILAGLYPKSTGEIMLDGQPLSGPGLNRGVVFQDFALFLWQDVRTNILCGVRQKGIPKSECEKIAGHYIHLMSLQGFDKTFPNRLSGGMHQRVVIVRAWRVLLAGELRASPELGLGVRIFDAQETLNSAVIHGGIIIIGFLGFTVERLVLRSLEVAIVQKWGMLREL